jgi:hypothetical protein
MFLTSDQNHMIPILIHKFKVPKFQTRKYLKHLAGKVQGEGDSKYKKSTPVTLESKWDCYLIS